MLSVNLRLDLWNRSGAATQVLEGAVLFGLDARDIFHQQSKGCFKLDTDSNQDNDVASLSRHDAKVMNDSSTNISQENSRFITVE